MSHRKIIEGLSGRMGSQSLLADKLGIGRSRITKWKTVGIPPRHWPKLLDLAKRHHYRLTLNSIANCSPPNRRGTANPPPVG